MQVVLHMPASCNGEFCWKINKKPSETGVLEMEKHTHSEKEAQREKNFPRREQGMFVKDISVLNALKSVFSIHYPSSSVAARRSSAHCFGSASVKALHKGNASI